MGTLENEMLLFGHFNTTQCPFPLSLVLYSLLILVHRRYPLNSFASHHPSMWYSPSLKEIRLWVVT